MILGCFKWWKAFSFCRDSMVDYTTGLDSSLPYKTIYDTLCHITSNSIHEMHTSLSHWWWAWWMTCVNMPMWLHLFTVENRSQVASFNMWLRRNHPEQSEPDTNVDAQSTWGKILVQSDCPRRLWVQDNKVGAKARERQSVSAKQKEPQGFLESTTVAVHTAQETEQRHRIVRGFS